MNSQQKTPDTISLLHDLTYEAANMCVQCGYCLPVCPTYTTLASETHSPRGRINLVKMAAEGKIDILEDLKEPIELCLGCRACEVVCPVNVPYGEIYNGALQVIAKVKKERQVRSSASDKTLQWMLKKVFPKKQRLRTLGSFAWFYQASHVDKVVRKTKLLDTISPKMAAFEKALPNVKRPQKMYQFGATYSPHEEPRARVAFFPGCVMDALMAEINKKTIELLRKIGCEVVIPEAATCCGALQAHRGEVEVAKELAQQNITAIEELHVNYIVSNAGGCGAMLYEYDELFANESNWQERAKQFKAKIMDITEILVALGPLPFTQKWQGVITYQDSCHLRNVQGVKEAPRQLLEAIPGATFIEMKNSQLCCASGGIYNVFHYEESMKMLDQKMTHALETNAQTIVTTNPGCLLQMRLGIERSGKADEMQALHIVEVLAEVCGV